MNKFIKGGEFLVKDIEAKDVFIPEEWSEEQKMIIQTCKDFINTEVKPHFDEIDSQKNPNLIPELLEKSGELGLLSLAVPEEYGGMGVDIKTSMLITEALGIGHSFTVAHGGQTGIGMLPLLYYGNTEQKIKYIPKLATGEWKAAYCLTEPSAGSDANSGKTKAVLSEDGKHYIINGQKMWITNAGFADLLTVFAKIDDDENLTAFLIEANSEGITLNPEEKKMGIKGSSTRQIFFNNVKVPAENLLFERNQGFKIAVNILNVGRIKLAAACVGGSKQAITDSVKYANEREQFGRSISKYGAIRHKLAQQATLVWTTEAATYRAAHDIDEAIEALIADGMDKEKATLKGIEEFAPECAILKVVGSEALDYVVDEGVQIHGGMGYSAETGIERAYRDARINRIFEGTNEINRLLTVTMILKKAMKGEIDLMGPAMAIGKELTGIPDFGAQDTSLFAAEKQYVKNFKKALLMVAGSAAQKIAEKLAKEQEVVMNVADIINTVYVAESAVLRAEKVVALKGEAAAQNELDMMRIYVYDAADIINKAAKDALFSFAEGDELKMMLMGLKRFTKHEPLNVKEARQRVALTLIDKNEYCF